MWRRRERSLPYSYRRKHSPIPAAFGLLRAKISMRYSGASERRASGLGSLTIYDDTSFSLRAVSAVARKPTALAVVVKRRETPDAAET